MNQQILVPGRERREFRFTEADFRRIRELAHEFIGIDIAPTKRDLVYGRLAKHIRRLGDGDFKRYLQRIKARDDIERERFINALTTNVTHFFREPHHFDTLAEELDARAARGAGPVKIWSAACSTGEEPYSIAMTLAEHGRPKDLRPGAIVASDIDSNCLRSAAEGVYPLAAIETIDPPRCRRHFLRGTGPREGHVRVKKNLRDLLALRSLNLSKDWAMQGMFDAIFCRNVLIYFSPEDRELIIGRLIRHLNPGGLLFLGHSEALRDHRGALRSEGRTTFRMST